MFSVVRRAWVPLGTRVPSFRVTASRAIRERVTMPHVSVRGILYLSDHESKLTASKRLQSLRFL